MGKRVKNEREVPANDDWMTPELRERWERAKEELRRTGAPSVQLFPELPAVLDDDDDQLMAPPTDADLRAIRRRWGDEEAERVLRARGRRDDDDDKLMEPS